MTDTSGRPIIRLSKKVSRAFAVIVIAAVVCALMPVGANAYVQTPIFRSQGNVTEVADPQNATNDVIRFNSTETGFSSVTRDLRAKELQVEDMTNMIAVKYFFVDRTCAGGSPRFQLNIDTGDGTVHNAFGYFGNTAFGGGCVPNTWVYEDLANLATTGATWDLTQFGGGFTNTWAQVVQFFATFYPNNSVRACGVFDDSGSFAPTSLGVVYLDNVQCHDRVLEDHQDVAPGLNNPF
jgi:hypothetical protein